MAQPVLRTVTESIIRVSEKLYYLNLYIHKIQTKAMENVAHQSNPRNHNHLNMEIEIGRIQKNT